MSPRARAHVGPLALVLAACGCQAAPPAPPRSPHCTPTELHVVVPGGSIPAFRLNSAPSGQVADPSGGAAARLWREAAFPPSPAEAAGVYRLSRFPESVELELRSDGTFYYGEGVASDVVVLPEPGEVEMVDYGRYEVRGDTLRLHHLRRRSAAHAPPFTPSWGFRLGRLWAWADPARSFDTLIGAFVPAVRFAPEALEADDRAYTEGLQRRPPTFLFRRTGGFVYLVAPADAPSFVREALTNGGFPGVDEGAPWRDGLRNYYSPYLVRLHGSPSCYG